MLEGAIIALGGVIFQNEWLAGFGVGMIYCNALAKNIEKKKQKTKE